MLKLNNWMYIQPTNLCLTLQMGVKQLRMTPLIQTFRHSHWLGLNPTLVPLILFLVPVLITLAWALANPWWPAHVEGISFLKPGGNLWTTAHVASQTLLSSCAKLSWYVLYYTNCKLCIPHTKLCMCELLCVPTMGQYIIAIGKGRFEYRFIDLHTNLYNTSLQ